MTKTQTTGISFQNFQKSLSNKNEAPPGLSKDKDHSKFNVPNKNLNNNGNFVFNKQEFAQNFIKSPKNHQINKFVPKEETKNQNNIENMTQNLAKNKIIPSFLVQKKAGDNITATTPSNNTHLKMNNFMPLNNKNSMLKTNAASPATNFSKTNNIFTIPKK